MTWIAFDDDVPVSSMCRTAAVLHSGTLSLDDGCQRRTAGRAAAEEEGDAEAELGDGLDEDGAGEVSDEALDAQPVASVPTPSRRTVRRGRSTLPA